MNELNNFYNRTFINGDKLDYYTQKLNYLKNGGNTLVLIDNSLYEYDITEQQYFQYKQNTNFEQISREEVINRLKYQIMVINRKKIEKIRSKI